MTIVEPQTPKPIVDTKSPLRWLSSAGKRIVSPEHVKHAVYQRNTGDGQVTIN